MDFEDRLDDLHEQIYELYRGRSTDQVLLNRLWHEVDKLEDAKKLTLKRQGGEK